MYFENTPGRPGQSLNLVKESVTQVMAAATTAPKKNVLGIIAVEEKIATRYLTLFENALFYSIANQATETFISKKPDSALTLLLTLLTVVLLDLTLLEYLQNKMLTVESNGPFQTFLDYAIFIFGICSQIFVQLLSTLAARYALGIFAETQSLEWTIAVSSLTVTILWVGKTVTNSMAD